MLCSIRYFKLRPLGQQSGQHAVAQQVGHLEPVPGRVQALQREVVGVIAASAGRLGPGDQRACRLSRTFCACTSSICCGISSQAKRRSRGMGTIRSPTERPGESSSGPG